MNDYTYQVVKSAAGFPLHIVSITSCYLAAFSVFNSAADAVAYIKEQKTKHKEYNVDIFYNPEKSIAGNCLKAFTTEEPLFSKLENRQLYIAPPWERGNAARAEWEKQCRIERG